MVMCSMIVACNTSVIRVLCHVGNRRNEPRRFSRASYALSRQHSNQAQNSHVSCDDTSFNKPGRSIMDSSRPLDGKSNSCCELMHDKNLTHMLGHTNCSDSNLPRRSIIYYKQLSHERDITSSCGQSSSRQLPYDGDSTSIRLNSSNNVCSPESAQLINSSKRSGLPRNNSNRSRRLTSSMRRASIASTGSATYKHATPEEISFAKLMTVLSILFVLCWMPQFVSLIKSKKHDV